MEEQEKEKIKKILAERVREIRKRAKLSQEDFAERLSVAPNTISRIEREESILTSEIAWKIRQEFSVNMEYLFGYISYIDLGRCSDIYGQLENAQMQIDLKDELIKELNRKIEGIQRILEGKNNTIM